MSDEQCEVLRLDLDRAQALRRSRLREDAAARAAGRARALADATRLSLVAALAEAEELCVCDLAWVTGRAQNLVSHHVRLLKAEGLAESRRDGKMVMYSITPDARRLLGAALGEQIPA